MTYRIRFKSGQLTDKVTQPTPEIVRIPLKLLGANVEGTQESPRQGSAAAPSTFRRKSAIICDTSGSMGISIANGIRRIDRLHETLDELTRGLTAKQLASYVFIEFNTDCWQHKPGPGLRFEPRGCTLLHLAIKMARENQCNHLLIVSDGQPDSTQKAIHEMSKFEGQLVVDCFYCGDPEPGDGKTFLKKLSDMTRGEAQSVDLSSPDAARQMASDVKRKLLGLPSPKDKR